MKTLYLLAFGLALAAVAHAQATSDIPAEMRQELDNAARVGTVMVDGDLCQKIVTESAKKYMFAESPLDPWLAGDNYDVDDLVFNAVKKTLIRLSHLTSFTSDVNLWMPIEGHPGKVQVVIRNRNDMSQFWKWGTLYQDMIPQMETVFKTGQRLAVTDRPGWVSVFAPVSNSLGDIVGVIEAASVFKVDAQPRM